MSKLKALEHRRQNTTTWQHGTLEHRILRLGTQNREH